MKGNTQGQSLIEILIGITIVSIIVGSATATIILSLRTNRQTSELGIASTLGQELLDNARAVAEGRWNNIYGVDAKGGNSQYYLTPTGTPLTLSVISGTESLFKNNATFTRWFSIENVGRDTDGNIATSSATDDVSTQKLTATIQWDFQGDTESITLIEYITRWSKNDVIRFTDWSGASDVDGPITIPDGNYYSASSVNITSGKFSL